MAINEKKEAFYTKAKNNYVVKKMQQTFSAVITKEKNWFVSYCPEVGVSSQGKTRKSAIRNLREAVELFLEEDPLGVPQKREVTEFKARVLVHA